VQADDTAGDVTILLGQLGAGDQDALARLLPLVYNELRRLAGYYMGNERMGHTLQPTALVHEAFVRLAGQHANWQSRAQFMGIAGQLMRRILVDYARKRTTAKRGGILVTLDEAMGNACADVSVPEEILALDEALERLAQLDPPQARIVELRYFAGLSMEETARTLGMPQRSVEREWAVAKAWLRAELSER
jgi:RNA polymerase sigma factor (TIGR02999 family)